MPIFRRGGTATQAKLFPPLLADVFHSPLALRFGTVLAAAPVVVIGIGGSMNNGAVVVAGPVEDADQAMGLYADALGDLVVGNAFGPEASDQRQVLFDDVSGRVTTAHAADDLADALPAQAIAFPNPRKGPACLGQFPHLLVTPLVAHGG